jgi:hypothetical protein
MWGGPIVVGLRFGSWLDGGAAELIARRGKRGRPTLGGAGPSTVESVRLDPELNDEVAERAKRDGVFTSDVIREALRRYLHAS